MSEREDVLDTGAPSRFGLWQVVALIAVLALLGWNLRSSPEQPAATPIAKPTAAERSGATTEPAPPPPNQPIDHVVGLAFVDDRAGFLMRYSCSHAPDSSTCTRSLLATVDGGRTWDVRGNFPTWAGSYYLLEAVSETEVALLDHADLDSVVQSFDGGRTWVQQAIGRGPPAPAPPGATVVQEFPAVCSATECAGPPAWIDLAARTLHPLPRQPLAGTDQPFWIAPMSPDGQLVASSQQLSAARVAMSVDGGSTWIEAVLDVPVGDSSYVEHVQAMAAGNGRAYAYVKVFGRPGGETTYGFRTDDAGASWVDLGWEQASVSWFPAAVLDGELIATSFSNQVQVTSGSGATWSPVDGAPREGWVVQSEPGGPVLLTASHGEAESYHLSFDGRTWTPMYLPR